MAQLLLDNGCLFHKVKKERKEPCMLKAWSRIFYVLGMSVIATAIAFISLLTFWAVYPYEGLKDIKSPVPVNQSRVYQGELLTYQIRYCVDEKLPLPITVIREIELQGPNGMIFPIAPTIGYMIQERCETRNIAVGIPIYQPPGVYHIHFMTALDVNPIRQYKQTFVSTEFEVMLNPKLPSQHPVTAGPLAPKP